MSTRYSKNCQTRYADGGEIGVDETAGTDDLDAPNDAAPGPSIDRSADSPDVPSKYDVPSTDTKTVKKPKTMNSSSGSSSGSGATGFGAGLSSGFKKTSDHGMVNGGLVGTSRSVVSPAGASQTMRKDALTNPMQSALGGGSSNTSSEARTYKK